MAIAADTRKRILARDGGCSGRFLGGRCSPILHVHHIVPRSEGGGDEDTNLMALCASHHPSLEALRRRIVEYRQRGWKTCRHKHRSADAKAQCERALNRGRVAA